MSAPTTFVGNPLANCPIVGARGFQRPVGLGTSGVLLLGEAMGDHEREAGYGFVESAPAGSVLERAIRRTGHRREEFIVWNVVPTQPPNNYLEGAPYEADAITWGRPFLVDILTRYRPSVIVALGNVAFRALTGLGDILTTRGYPVPSNIGPVVIGALHPSFLRRGAMAYLGVLMHDLSFAVALAQAIRRAHEADTTLHVEFWSPVLWRQVHYVLPWPLRALDNPLVPPGYMLYPTQLDALRFADDVNADVTRLVAYDIETPRSAKLKEDESDEADDESEHNILSVQFSLSRDTGIFLPWRDPFTAIGRRILASGNPKVGANNWRFDDPRLRRASVRVEGQRHDLRWAWKHFQPDLSAGLQFVTSFYAPEVGPWKHLNESRPQFYGIRDVDAVQRCL